MCKTTLSDVVGRTIVQYFKSEATMYSRILPALKNIATFKEPLPWPRCFYTTESTSARPCLIFEDLGLEGFVTANRRAIPDVQQLVLALSQLAKFHGAGMALQHLKPAEFKEMTKDLGLVMAQDDPAEMKKFQQFFSMIQGSLEIIEDRFPAGSDVNNKVKAVYAGLQTFFMSLVAVPEPGPGIGLAHGDCHPNNMMFQYDKMSGAVKACRLIDFQLSRLGHTAMDVATLLLPSTDKALRDEHWDDLLQGYHRELQETLRASGIGDPDSIYTFEQFTGFLRESAKYALCLAPIALHAMYADEQEATELRDALNEFHKTGSEQAGGVPFTIAPSEAVKQRFCDIIQSLVDWGWL